MAKNRQQQEFERRLAVAFKAGHFDGFHEGIEVAHAQWVEELPKIPHIGAKRMAVILKHMTEAMERRVAEAGMAKNELLKEVDLSDGATEHTCIGEPTETD